MKLLTDGRRTDDAPINENGLIHMIRMGMSIRYMWVKTYTSGVFHSDDVKLCNVNAHLMMIVMDGKICLKLKYNHLD